MNKNQRSVLRVLKYNYYNESGCVLPLSYISKATGIGIRDAAIAASWLTKKGLCELINRWDGDGQIDGKGYHCTPTGYRRSTKASHMQRLISTLSRWWR